MNRPRFPFGGEVSMRINETPNSEPEHDGNIPGLEVTSISGNPETEAADIPYSSGQFSTLSLLNHVNHPRQYLGRFCSKKETFSQVVETGHELDRAAFGLKTVYQVATAKIDIIPVHGLNGHWRGSFTADNGVCWLTTLLPESFPDIRVFSYGYDAIARGSSLISREHLHDHAEQLIQALTSERMATETTSRPIIFIGHSLGGLIVKSALILSASFNSNYLGDQKDIKLSTSGVLFMGTPHGGANGVQNGGMALGVASIFRKTNKEYLRHLEEHSEWLEYQQIQYLGISKDFTTKYFYESYSTPLSRGRSLLVVPKHSACIPGAMDAARIVIYGNHTDMVKYKDAGDDGYKKVERELFTIIREAKRVEKYQDGYH